MIAISPPPSILTLGTAVAAAAAQLEAAGIESPRREARLILALATGLDEASILGWPERPLAAAAAKFERLVARRAQREPFARLAGKREFWSLDFTVTPATLDPRPDSETVVEAALAGLPRRDAALRIADLGTGTGCLLLALLSELPQAVGIGIDLDPRAAAVARHNAAINNLKSRAFFTVSRWGEAIGGEFDLIVANPPYIPTAAIPDLAAEVAAYDPTLALDGGGDGLRSYRGFAPDLPRLLRPSGFACVEMGAGQATAIAEIFAAAGLEQIGRHRDLGGVERCIVVRPR